jgi:hypothetical protein
LTTITASATIPANYNRILLGDHLIALIQRGEGTGPMKPQQPPKMGNGANSGKLLL